MSALYTYLVLLLALLATFATGQEPPHVTVAVDYYKCGEAYNRDAPGVFTPMLGSFSPQFNCGKFKFKIAYLPITHFRTTSWNCICSIYRHNEEKCDGSTGPGWGRLGAPGGWVTLWGQGRAEVEWRPPVGVRDWIGWGYYNCTVYDHDIHLN